MTHIYNQRKNENPIERPEADVCDILEFVGRKIFSRKLLKLKTVH